jgi:hypothetical protein
MFFARASHSLLGLMLIQAFLFLFFLLGCSKRVVFDPERGFYNASFELKLELPEELKDSKAVIRYFVYKDDPSGPDPTATTGTAYKSKIPITSSCYVLASAFLNGQAVTSMSVHTFMFASNIITDTYIDSSQQNLAFDGPEKIIRGFLSIPSISMTTPFAYPYAPISYVCIPCMAANPRFVRVEWLDSKHPKVIPFD